MFERYTEKARRAIFFARYEASQFGSQYIETEHLLLGLLREDEALRKVVRSPSVDVVRNQIEARTPVREKVSTSVDLPLSQECKHVLAYAAQEADRASDGHIRTGHLLLGLLREEKCLAAEIVSGFGVKISELREELARKNAADQPEASAEGPIAATASPVERPVMRQALYKLRIEGWGRQFHWERLPSEPRPALRHTESGRIQLYRGQPYDSAKFELVEGGWTDYHCILCWATLFVANDLERSVGYSNGQDWLCLDCYARFVGESS